MKGVEFDLPITKATQASFSSPGKLKQKGKGWWGGETAYSGGFAGVYVLTHIAPVQKQGPHTHTYLHISVCVEGGCKGPL